MSHRLPLVNFMKPILNQGRIINWKDERGFGFIKPDDDGQEVFLHISALTARVRRPKVGDTVLYKKVTQPDGKIRAIQVSIQGVAPQFLSAKQKPRKRGLLGTVVGMIIMGVISLSAIEFTPSRSPSPIASITKPKCTIKGNISQNTDSKIYHLSGMEDYESTVIDAARGEKWFCTESEAIANGWRKAPR